MLFYVLLPEASVRTVEAVPRLCPVINPLSSAGEWVHLDPCLFEYRFTILIFLNTFSLRN